MKIISGCGDDMVVVGYIIQVNLRVFHSILRTFYRQNCNNSITFFLCWCVLCNSRLCVVCVVSRLCVGVVCVVGVDAVSNAWWIVGVCEKMFWITLWHTHRDYSLFFKPQLLIGACLPRVCIQACCARARTFVMLRYTIYCILHNMYTLTYM